MNTTELATLMWAAKRAADAIDQCCPGSGQLELNHVEGGLAIVKAGMRVEVRFCDGDLLELVYLHQLATPSLAAQCRMVAEQLGVEVDMILVKPLDTAVVAQGQQPVFPAALLGCDGECGFTPAGVGYQCSEGDGCGRYVHPGDTGFTELNAYHMHMVRTEAFRTQLRRLGMVDSDDDIECVFDGDTVRIVSQGDHGPGCTLPVVVALEILSSTAAGTEPFMVWRAFEGWLKDEALRADPEARALCESIVGRSMDDEVDDA
jgi:hypothetical protein